MKRLIFGGAGHEILLFVPKQSRLKTKASTRARAVNAIRAHLGEFGIAVPKGIHNMYRLLEAAQDMPEAARPALDVLTGQLSDLEERIEAATACITAAQKADPLAGLAGHAGRLATIPGLGPIASSAFAATRPDVAAFRFARE